MKQRTYIAIDLKSFYASVECRKRGLDPLDTNLVVADESRTDKTICLAVTPRLWRLTSSSRRPGWRITWSTAPASIRFVQVLMFGYVNVSYTRKMRFAACG